jgi:hypothetical protein
MIRVNVVAVVAWGLMAALAASMVFFFLWINFGAQVVSCVNTYGPGSRYEPAIIVRVETHRKGHITERHFLGCTFYGYHGPP